jgi:hypothetical protein
VKSTKEEQCLRSILMKGYGRGRILRKGENIQPPRTPSHSLGGERHGSPPLADESTSDVSLRVGAASGSCDLGSDVLMVHKLDDRYIYSTDMSRDSEHFQPKFGSEFGRLASVCIWSMRFQCHTSADAASRILRSGR